MIIPERGSERAGIVVVYDLRDPDVWQQARNDREQWGRSRSEVYALDNDRTAVVFEPGGVLEEST